MGTNEVRIARALPFSHRYRIGTWYAALPVSPFGFFAYR